MDIYQLEYVLALAKYRNFTRASEELNISQSSLSQQIAKLEDELGIRLFERTTRSVYLSPAGLDFLKHAQKVIEECNLAKQTVQKYLSAECGKIVIGCIPITGIYEIPSLITSFQQKYPGIEVKFLEAQCIELLDMLKNNEIDLTFAHYYKAYSGIIFRNLIYDELALATSSSHRFADRVLIDLHEVHNENFIMPKSNTAIYFDIGEACRKAGFEPNIIHQCETVDSILGFVQANTGVTLLSYKVLSFYSRIYPAISIIRLIPFAPRALSLATTKNSDSNPTVRLFKDFAENYIGSQYNDPPLLA